MRPQHGNTVKQSRRLALALAIGPLPVLALGAAAAFAGLRRDLAGDLALVAVGVATGCAALVFRSSLASQESEKTGAFFRPNAWVVKESAAFLAGAVLAFLCFGLLFGRDG